jgi:hypothetical protein
MISGPTSSSINLTCPPHRREVCDILARGILRLRIRSAKERTAGECRHRDVGASPGRNRDLAAGGAYPKWSYITAPLIQPDVRRNLPISAKRENSTDG